MPSIPQAKTIIDCFCAGRIRLRLLQKRDENDATSYLVMLDSADDVLGNERLFFNVPMYTEDDLNDVVKLLRDAKRFINVAEGRIPSLFFREPRNWLDLLLRYRYERQLDRRIARPLGEYP